MSIELLVLDVDGTLTDGKIVYTNDNKELKVFDVKDGLAIVSWRKLGKKVAIITGRESEIVKKRAKELGVDYLVQKSSNKKEALEEILKKEKLSWQNVAVVGDDINDYHILKNSQLSFAVNNATIYAKEAAKITLSKSGGDGAVREAIEYLIEYEGLKKRFLELWGVESSE
ncbi:MAG: HAD-IIIA family hydrolase [Epsilonproteobacteria bacterium]|nr:HAD-IIIA family hydrolase [Campylobacterota bacterium]